MKIRACNANEPVWESVTIKSQLPDKLKKLSELAHNMWWVWNVKARKLWEALDLDLYKEVGKNPVLLLERLSYERLEELSKNEEILDRMDEVYNDFRSYMDVKPDKTRPSVAYFCMEYGLSHTLQIYSGGLGILAGDYLKEASDSNVDMCAVGFLYRVGYFKQTLTSDGQQVAVYESQNFGSLPIMQLRDEKGNPLVVDVPYMNNSYQVHAYLWQVNVGRIKLYLLDTDNNLNSEYDRPITQALYGGDWENRMKQEILLGIGGVLALKKLGIKKDVYHCNEGHAALCNVQRLVDYRQEGLSFNEALELVRASGLYTVHTPVPAGHDYFDEGLFGKYMRGYETILGISWDEFIGMGRQNPDDHNEKFCMSTFACNTCQEVNGVSKLHGIVSQEMFAGIWKGYFPEENHVGYVTNGVHLPTWTASEWRALYDKYFDKSFLHDQSNEKIWEQIYNVPDKELWETHKALKAKLVKFVQNSLMQTWLRNQGDPTKLDALMEKFNPNALIIGFARRFATYKRAHLLFSDLDWLSRIVNNPKYPVQFVFAGKAHPQDGAGQGLIKKIYEISQRPEFIGKIVFVENYNMELARRLISGVDIWMNTPTRLMEASGTSGEKALMNGVVNFSVLDGWWYEGYRKNAGWALSEKTVYSNPDYQDKADAITIYSMLEKEILPMYHDLNEEGYSERWVQVMKNSIAQIAPHYTMKRQLDDYYDKFYTKEATRFHKLAAHNYELAKKIAAWKQTVAERWDNIRVVTSDIDADLVNGDIVSGKDYKYKFVVDEQGLSDVVGIEIVTCVIDKDGGRHVANVCPLEMTGHVGNLYTFEGNHAFKRSGACQIAFRMYPKNDNLPHRQDFCYVKYIK